MSPHTVELLTKAQIRAFKRDGFLILPAILDPELCARARDDMWETISANLPRMKREDPATWGPITEQESERFDAKKPADGSDPHFNGSGHRFTVRNGTSELMLDLAPRAMWHVAEQLLGKDTLVWPAGLDKAGKATGPCLMCDDTVMNLTRHAGYEEIAPTFRTAPSLPLPLTGPVWLNGQGTRGLYCTLPGSPDPGPDLRSAHSDGAVYGRWRLQMAAYIDDVPPESGAFTVWPGSHARIWPEQWAAFHDGERHTDRHLKDRKAGGYTDPVIRRIKADTEPFDCHGQAGTVVLWHTKILHMAGQNRSESVIRQATIYSFLKTVESLSDELAMDDAGGDIWRDWSQEVRSVTKRAA